MSAASLVVTISANINDFSKNLDKMTKDVDKAAKKVADIGKALTLGITLPAAAASVGLAKLAADNEDTAGRMQRVFGSAADAMEGSITRMMASVPEARTELEKMAISIDNMLQGMDLAPSTAATMSESVLKLAGDVAAFNHVPMDEALDAIEHGLAGKTKGLLTYGIAITEADIKQKAFAMGMLSSGRELTESGTALVAYSLIMDRTTRIQGEAGRTAEQSGKSFAFLKVDMIELADKVSALVLPTMSSLAKGAIDVIDAMNKVPESLTKVVFGITGFMAVAVPLLVILPKIAAGFNAITSAISIASKAGGFITFIADIAEPLGLILVVIGLVTAAVYGLKRAWDSFHPSAQTLAAPLTEDKNLVAAIAAQNAAANVAGKNGPTSRPTGDPLAQFEARAKLVSAAFESAVEHGTSLSRVVAQINGLHAEAVTMLTAQGGAFTKEGEAAQNVADQMQRMQDIIAVANGSLATAQNRLNQIAARPFDAAVAGAVSAVDAANKYRQDLATRAAASQYTPQFDVRQESVIRSREQVRSTDQDLSMRQAALGLPDGFNAAKQAAVELAEAQRSAAEQTALQFEKIKIGLGGFGQHLDGLGLGMQSVVVNLYDAATSFAQNLEQQLAGKGPGAGIGGSLGGLIGGALVAHFAAAGSVFGPLGTAAGGIAGALFGSHFDHATKNTTDSMNTLATTTDKVNEALSNLPEGFKIARDRFLAQAGVTVGGGGGGGGGGSPGPGGGPILPGTASANTVVVHGDLHVNGVNVTGSQSLVREILAGAKASMRRGGQGLLLASTKA